MTMYTESRKLRVVPPFNFAQSMAFLGGFRPMNNEQTLSGDRLVKAVSVAGQVVAFQVRSSGSIEEPALTYTLFSEKPIAEETRRASVERASFFLSLSDDLRSFYAVGQEDPAFAPIVSRLYGLHQVKFLTPFENACWAILSQRNLMTVSRKMKQALVEEYGGKIEIDGVTYWAFPEPDRLAAADPYDLATLIGHGPKGEGVSAVARAFKGVDEQFLRTAPYEEAEAWLRKIRGIGEWSASFVLLRGLGRMERAPLTEKHLLAAINNVYAPTHDMSQESIERLAAKYGPYQGYWAYYLRAASM